MNIFEYLDYKIFLTQRVKSMPHNGRGQYKKLAAALNVNSTVISQIFKGSRDLSPDQALVTSDFLGLDALEKKYFLQLVLLSRAATHELKKYLERECLEIRQKALKLKERIIKHKEVSEEKKGVFYSNWSYSATRLLTSIPSYQSLDSISEHLGLPKVKTKKILTFLVENGLCVQEQNEYKIGPQHTHISDDSPFIDSHRRNWRQKGLEHLNKMNTDELFFSSPLTLSKADKKVLREKTIEFIKNFMTTVQSSEEEILCCLNIDWFEV